jgi:hypothetical protein
VEPLSVAAVRLRAKKPWYSSMRPIFYKMYRLGLRVAARGMADLFLLAI